MTTRRRGVLPAMDAKRCVTKERSSSRCTVAGKQVREVKPSYRRRGAGKQLLLPSGKQLRTHPQQMLPSLHKTGYFGVYLDPRCSGSKPYEARVRRGGKTVSLGRFATAEEAALCVARSPEGQEAAKKAAAALRMASEEGGQGAATTMRSGAVLKEEGVVPPMPLGAVIKEEEVAPPLPPGAFFKEEGVVPLMPPDAIVKQEHEIVVKEEERSADGPKRRRSK